jgi:hypothetical protein
MTPLLARMLATPRLFALLLSPRPAASTPTQALWT